jgi:transcriptional regulator with XRE-family HTH domain
VGKASAEARWLQEAAGGRIGPNPEQREKLYEAAEQGYSMSACAANAGISRHNLSWWLNKGRPAAKRLMEEENPELTPAEKIYAGFAEEFERARARGVRYLEDIATKRANEGMGTWSEAVTKLERGHKDEWGRQPEVVGGGAPTVIVIEARPGRELTDEVIEGRLVDGTEDQRALPPASPAAGVSE